MMHKMGRAFIKNAERPMFHVKHTQFKNSQADTSFVNRALQGMEDFGCKQYRATKFYFDLNQNAKISLKINLFLRCSEIEVVHVAPMFGLYI